MKEKQKYLYYTNNSMFVKRTHTTKNLFNKKRITHL